VETEEEDTEEEDCGEFDGEEEENDEEEGEETEEGEEEDYDDENDEEQTEEEEEEEEEEEQQQQQQQQEEEEVECHDPVNHNLPGISALYPSQARSAAKTKEQLHGTHMEQFQVKFYSCLARCTASHVAKEVAWALAGEAARMIVEEEARTSKAVKWPVYRTVRNYVEKQLPPFRYDYAIRDNDTGVVVVRRDKEVIERIKETRMDNGKVQFEVLYDVGKIKVYPKYTIIRAGK
jgi:hypothetical protein